MTKRNRYYFAQKITEKHESGVGDGRKILRAAGVGEVAVVLKIKELMEAESKNIQAKGVELAVKYLGMGKENVGSHPGITIVIQGTDQGPAGPAPDRPAQPEPKALPSPTAICITR